MLVPLAESFVVGVTWVLSKANSRENSFLTIVLVVFSKNWMKWASDPFFDDKMLNLGQNFQYFAKCCFSPTHFYSFSSLKSVQTKSNHKVLGLQLTNYFHYQFICRLFSLLIYSSKAKSCLIFCWSTLSIDSLIVSARVRVLSSKTKCVF